MDKQPSHEVHAVALGRFGTVHGIKPTARRMAELHLGQDTLSPSQHIVTIMTSAVSPSDGEGYEPPHSVEVRGDAIVPLRDFLNFHYPQQQLQLVDNPVDCRISGHSDIMRDQRVFQIALSLGGKSIVLRKECAATDTPQQMAEALHKALSEKIAVELLCDFGTKVLEQLA